MTLKSKIEAVLFVTAKAMQVSEIAEILKSRVYGENINFM